MRYSSIVFSTSDWFKWSPTGRYWVVSIFDMVTKMMKRTCFELLIFMMWMKKLSPERARNRARDVGGAEREPRSSCRSPTTCPSPSAKSWTQKKCILMELHVRTYWDSSPWHISEAFGRGLDSRSVRAHLLWGSGSWLEDVIPRVRPGRVFISGPGTSYCCLLPGHRDPSSSPSPDPCARSSCFGTAECARTETSQPALQKVFKLAVLSISSSNWESD